MSGYGIVDFYEACVQFFSYIIDTGFLVWQIFTSKFSVLIEPMEDGILKTIIQDVINISGDVSILEIGFGGGLVLFIFVTLLKFFNVLS